MKNLKERFRNTDGVGDNLTRMNPEEIADVLFCLCNAFDEGKLIQAAPENISVAEDGTVSVTPDADKDIYYAAPEVVLGRSGADKNSGWFTMGLLTYFIINGRSWCEAKGTSITELPDLVGKGTGLIQDQESAGGAGNVPGLLSAAMAKFTSWKPETRSEGVFFLLKVIRQYTSTAVIQYTFAGRIISTERQRLDPPSVKIAAGYRVTDESGSTFQVTCDREVPFRPGTHSYTVEVESEAAGRNGISGDYAAAGRSGISDDYASAGRSGVSGSQETGGAEAGFEKYLCIQRASRQRMTKLFKLEQTPELRKIEVDRSNAENYLFYVATGDPVRRKTVRLEYKFHVNVPAGRTGEKSLLYVSYEPPADCRVELYNRAGTMRISDNALLHKL